MTNKTFYFLIAAVIALVAYVVWVNSKLKATKEDNQNLENGLVHLSNKNKYLSTQNDELMAENQNLRRFLNQ